MKNWRGEQTSSFGEKFLSCLSFVSSVLNVEYVPYVVREQRSFGSVAELKSQAEVFWKRVSLSVAMARTRFLFAVTIVLSRISSRGSDAVDMADLGLAYDDYEDLNSLLDVDESAFTAAKEAASHETSIGAFLESLTLEKLNDLDTATLLTYATNKAVGEYLPAMRNDVVRRLLERIPSSVQAEIASRPGLLEAMPDDKILIFADSIDALKLTQPSVLSSLANNRPELIERLPAAALNEFMQMPTFVRSLTSRTIMHLIHSARFADRVRTLPRHSVAAFVSSYPEVLATLPAEDYPAREYVQKLIHDREFLALIPVRVHAWLAESDFRFQLEEESVLLILSVVPELPKHLSSRALQLNSRYLRNVAFLNRMSCSVYLNLATDNAFLDRLSEADLQALSLSRQMWSCLPVSVIRKMMKESHVGRKLSVNDIAKAAKTMSITKSLDWRVVSSVFQYQVPLFWQKGFKDAFHLLDDEFEF